MANMTYEDKTELWQLRMREVQGAIIVASLFQVVMGTFGIYFYFFQTRFSAIMKFNLGVVGMILRYITPLTIAPSIFMVGLSLFGPAGRMSGKHWGISTL